MKVLDLSGSMKKNRFVEKQLLKKESSYVRLSPEFKTKWIKYAKKHGLQQACKMSHISRQNIERWMVHGVHRKKSTGRKVANAELESQLIAWIDRYSKNKGLLNRHHPKTKGNHKICQIK